MCGARRRKSVKNCVSREGKFFGRFPGCADHGISEVEDRGIEGNCAEQRSGSSGSWKSWIGCREPFFFSNLINLSLSFSTAFPGVEKLPNRVGLPQKGGKV